MKNNCVLCVESFWLKKVNSLLKIYVCFWRLCLLTTLQFALVLVRAATCFAFCSQTELEAWMCWNANSFHHLYRTALANRCVSMQNSCKVRSLLCCVVLCIRGLFFQNQLPSYWTRQDIVTALCAWSAVWCGWQQQKGIECEFSISHKSDLY